MIRYAAYPFGYLWALPNSLVGLLFLPLALASGGRARLARGALEIYGGFVAWYLRKCCGGVGSMTLGHVILSRDRRMLDYTRNHEHVHIGQYMRWGPLFIPMYLGSSYLCWRKGKNPYFENRFERVAYGLFPSYGEPPAGAEKTA
jgi:hypothetical protein